MSNRPSRKASRTAGRAAGRPGARSSARGLWIFGGVGVAVLLAAVVALTVSSGSGASFEHGEPELRGEPLPQLADGTTDPAVGRPAPEVFGRGFEGELSEITRDGQPKVVVFLAHWCPHCQAEVPEVQDWIDDGGVPEGVDLYSVVTLTDRTRGNFPPDDWLEGEGWTVPVLVDSEDSAVATAFGLSGTPFWVAIDAEGNVASRTSSRLTIEQLEAFVGIASV